MAKEYIAAYKDGSDYISFFGQVVRNDTRGEIDYADAFEEYADAEQNNRYARPIMLVRDYGKPWRKMTATEMRKAAD